MLADYGDTSYPLNETDSMMMSRADMDPVVVASTHQDPYGMFGFLGHVPDSRWSGGSEATDSSNNYSLTVLSDGRHPSDNGEQALHRDHHHHYHQGYPAPSWDLHGTAHSSSDECAVSGSDGTEPDTSPDRRCVKSLLHVALQKGSGFAQQFTSCGVPTYPVKQEFVTSTSPMSPRPMTPADSFRSYSPGYSSPAYPSILPPTSSPAFPSVITSTSSSAYAPSAPPSSSEDVVSTTTALGYSSVGYHSPMSSYSAFRSPFPTPSPQPPYASTIVPLPVHLLPTVMPPFSEQATPPPSTPSTTATKRRRSKTQHQGNSGTAGAAPKKRERSERQLHPCTLCEKRFKDNYSVNVHMRTHTGEKPFPCVVCGKMFRQKAHLAKHRSTHQPSDYARLENRHHSMTNHGSVDNNANSLPLWMSTPAAPETKCKTNSLWTPSVISAPVRTVQ